MLDLAGDWTLRSFCEALAGMDLFPTKAPERDVSRRYRTWAFESAALDLALRQAGAALHEVLGRVPRPLTFVVSLRLGEPPTLDPVTRRLERYPTLRFKLDPTSSWDEELIAGLVATGAVDSVDFKGMYEGTVIDQPADPVLYRRVVEAFPDAWIEDPKLTDEIDALLREPDLPEVAGRVLRVGGARLALHLRGPRTPAARLYELARALLPTARDAGAFLLVNDRVDLALVLALDGVHLGERSLPVAAVRELLGRRWIGRSVHGAPAAREAAEQGADYLVVGTVFATPSHPRRAPAGPEIIRAVRETTRLPLLAIGGVTPARVADVVAVGARGVAVRSGVWDAAEPEGAVQGYLEALAAAGGDRAGAPSPAP
ncbi:MAG: thiamine phosphate synthase [Gemmatimonadetes bacterium]|nr:thiamine phosphate synthase [Gemmatimonadota bacterium]